MLAVLLVVTCVVALTPPAAHAGGHGAARVAIGLATFAIFAPFIIVGEILALAVPPYRAPAVVAAPPPVYYAPPPAYSAPPPAYSAPAATYSAPPAYVRQTYAAPALVQPIQYPHGRYELRGDGIATVYQWVWIPNPTIPSPAPGAPPAYSAAPPAYSSAPPAYSAPAPTYSAPPAYVRQNYAAPAPAQPTVVQYPHGQYELRGDGIATAYQWVWIPNPTIPSPPPAAPPAPPAASQ
jgi:hypothetical protein